MRALLIRVLQQQQQWPPCTRIGDAGKPVTAGAGVPASVRVSCSPRFSAPVQPIGDTPLKTSRTGRTRAWESGGGGGRGVLSVIAAAPSMFIPLRSGRFNEKMLSSNPAESRPLRRAPQRRMEMRRDARGVVRRGGGRPIRRFLSCLQPTFASSLRLLRLCLRRVPPDSPSRRSGYLFFRSGKKKKKEPRNPLCSALLSPVLHIFTSRPAG